MVLIRLQIVQVRLRKFVASVYDTLLTKKPVHSVNSIAQTAVYQLQRTDIRVNTICPGLIETGMTIGVFEPARARGNEGKIGQLNPLGRYGLPQGVLSHFFHLRGVAQDVGHAEIANVALFLASDESSYVNGQAWAVDGGLSSSHPVVPGRFH